MPAAAADGVSADEALGIWIRARTGRQPALEAMQAVLAADGLCACPGCAARALAWAADQWLGGVGAALVMAAVLERARARDAASGHRAAPGEEAVAVAQGHGRTLAVHVEHSLSLVDLAEVLCRWAATQPHFAAADPPTSREEAFGIVRDTLASVGERWDEWREDAGALDAEAEAEAAVCTAYGWAARFFGPLFGEREREQLARRLAMEVAGQPPF